MPEIIDWRQAAAPDDLARHAAQALAGGHLVALPTEAGYMLAADALSLGGNSRPHALPATLPVERIAGLGDVQAFLDGISASPRERFMANRLWPGPLAWVNDELPFPAWLPSHRAPSALLAVDERPIAFFELNAGQPVDVTGIDGVALALLDDPPRAGPLSVIRPDGVKFAIVREGVIPAAELYAALARRIVFVCTGNTCRSPLAEALFKMRLAERLCCATTDLPARGYSVSSAGLSAASNDPATAESIAAAQALGADLSHHRSRAATFDNVATADDLIVMTRSHLHALLGRYPAFNGSVRLLCGMAGDLNDPILGGSDTYRACAGTILHHVDRLISEMGLP